MILKKIDTHTWVFDSTYSQADELLDDVLENFTDSWKISEEKLKKILVQFPDCIDGWMHLAIVYQNTRRDVEAYLATREAYRIGLKAFPKKFNWKKDLLEWSFYENRPFLRVCFNLSLQMLETPLKDEAIEMLETLISISPHDNLGARYLLLKIYLQEENSEALERIYQQYPEDYSAEFYYGKVLWKLQKDDISAAESALLEAKEAFPYVLKELKKKQHRRPKNFNEAYVYWKNFSALWAPHLVSYQFLLSHSS